MSIKSPKFHYIILFILFFLCLCERIIILLKLGFVYTDIDQMVLWQTAVDMSKGLFYSPTFYGQSYGPNLEPFLAVPFIWMGIKPMFALPIVTSLIVFCSFSLFSRVFYLKKGILFASIPWIILLALPLNFSMITVLSRGWVGVLLFFSLSFYCFNLENYRLSAFFLAISLWFNPLILVMFPIFFWFQPINLNVIKKLLPFFILGLLPQFLSYIFFKIHPEYIVHASPKIQASFAIFWKNFKLWDVIYFRNITPYFWKNTQIFMLIIPIVSFIILNYVRKKSIILLICYFGVIFISFFDTLSTPSVYLNGSRYYLFYPFIWFFIVLLLLDWKKNFVIFLSAFSCILFIHKILNHQQLISKAINEEFYIVKPNLIEERLNKCQKIEKLSPELVIGMGINFTEYSILYGCPILLENNKIKFIDSNYERKVFHTQKILEGNYSKILLQANKFEVFKKYIFKDFDEVIEIEEQNQVLLKLNNPKTGKEIFEIIFKK